MELINSLSELQHQIMTAKGMPEHIQQPKAASVEPLKTPICVLRQYLGYADFPESRVQRQWLASFKTSPPDYLSECIVQIKNGDIPVENLDLRRSLIDFYSDLIEGLEQ